MTDQEQIEQIEARLPYLDKGDIEWLCDLAKRALQDSERMDAIERIGASVEFLRKGEWRCGDNDTGFGWGSHRESPRAAIDHLLQLEVESGLRHCKQPDGKF